MFASRLTRVIRWLFRTIGVGVLISVALLILLNLATRPYSFVAEGLNRDRRRHTTPATPPSTLAQVYPGKSDEEIAAIQRDTLESRHLERLIKEGRKPNHVVFIDGLNEFCRIPLNRPREDEPNRLVMSPLIFKRIVTPALFWRETGCRTSRSWTFTC